MCEWPDFLPGLEAWPAKHHGPHQLQPSEGVVLHCGKSGGDLAGYCGNPSDGRIVSYHVVLDRVRQRRYQMVSLQYRAWHASTWGNDWVGLALRGPASINPREDWERWALQVTLRELMAAMPSVRFWCRHSDISETRRDPGPGVRNEWLTDLGLAWRRP